MTSWIVNKNTITNTLTDEKTEKKITKLAIFDLDGTIVKTMSGRNFPKKGEGWRYYSTNTIDKLKEVIRDGYEIVVVTNQYGIRNKKDKQHNVMVKCEKIMEDLDLNFHVFMALQKDDHRKPDVGFFDQLLEEFGEDVELKNCFYVGDAAGRVWDHSDSDLLFAENCGINFYTPEEFFLLNDKGKYIVEEVKEQEMVMLVGPPASGKSTFCQKYFPDYIRVNKDTLKTISNCTKLTISSLDGGKSVIIDNTNRAKKNRSEFLKIAADRGIKVRCFWLDLTVDLTKRLNSYRFKMGGKKLSKMAGIYYYSHFEKPELEEGFRSIETVPFLFEGSREELEEFESI